MNFSEDRDVDIDLLYLIPKFELDQFTTNGDLSTERKKKWNRTNKQAKTDTLSIYHIGSSKN